MFPRQREKGAFMLGQSPTLSHTKFFKVVLQKSLPTQIRQLVLFVFLPPNPARGALLARGAFEIRTGDLTWPGRGAACWIQGYLAHKKLPPPLGPP